MKYKEIEKLEKKEIEKKLKELQLELVKAKGNAQKTNNNKAKEIKKMIARIYTLQNKKFAEKK